MITALKRYQVIPTTNLSLCWLLVLSFLNGKRKKKTFFMITVIMIDFSACILDVLDIVLKRFFILFKSSFSVISNLEEV